MADSIVEGLFGLSPWQIHQQQQRQLATDSSAFANMNAAQRGAMGMYQAGAGIGGLGAGMLGLPNPAIEQARMIEASLSGIDMTNPDAILQRAAQINDPRLKMRLTMVANKRNDELRRAAIEERKANLAEQKQSFIEDEMYKMKKAESEARIAQGKEQLRLNEEKLKNERLSAEESNSIKRENNDIRRMLGLAMLSLKQTAAKEKADKISNIDAKSIDKSLQASSSANSALQLLDQADNLYSQYASGRDEPILGQAGRWGAAVGLGDKKRVADFEIAGQIAKDLGVIKLGLIGGSDTERELLIAIDTSPSPDKLPSTNRAIIANQRRAIEVLQAEPDFKTEWVNKNGSLSALDKESGDTYGKAWRRYQKENFKRVVNPRNLQKEPVANQQSSRVFKVLGKE